MSKPTPTIHLTEIERLLVGSAMSVRQATLKLKASRREVERAIRIAGIEQRWVITEPHRPLRGQALAVREVMYSAPTLRGREIAARLGIAHARFCVLLQAVGARWVWCKRIEPPRALTNDGRPMPLTGL